MKFLARIFKSKENNRKNTRADSFKDNTNATNYVNSNNFSSATNYFIWVNLKEFKVNIFKGSTNKWVLVHSYLCTIGKWLVQGFYRLIPVWFWLSRNHRTGNGQAGPLSFAGGPRALPTTIHLYLRPHPVTKWPKTGRPATLDQAANAIGYSAIVFVPPGITRR